MNNTNAQKYKSSIFNQENRTKFIARVNLNKLVRLAAIILFLLLSTIISFDRVQAASFTYYLQDVNFFGDIEGSPTFFGGGGVTGSFVFDSDTGLFSNVNVVATTYTDSTRSILNSETFSLAKFDPLFLINSTIVNSISFFNGSSSSLFNMVLAGELPTVSGTSMAICGQSAGVGIPLSYSCPGGAPSGYYASALGESRQVQVDPYQPLLTVGSSTEVPEPSTVAGLLAFVTLGGFALRNRRCIKP
jgi:PEP-CTERM motif